MSDDRLFQSRMLSPKELCVRPTDDQWLCVSSCLTSVCVCVCVLSTTVTWRNTFAAHQRLSIAPAAAAAALTTGRIITAVTDDDNLITTMMMMVMILVDRWKERTL